MKRGLVVLASFLASVAALSIGFSGSAPQTVADSSETAFGALLANGKLLPPGGAAKYETPGDAAAVT